MHIGKCIFIRYVVHTDLCLYICTLKDQFGKTESFDEILSSVNRTQAHLGALEEEEKSKLLKDIGAISHARFMGTGIVNLKCGLFDGIIPPNILSVEERQGS